MLVLMSMQKSTARSCSIDVVFQLGYSAPVTMSMKELREQIEIMLAKPVKWQNGSVEFTISKPTVMIIDRRNEAPEFVDLDDVPF